MATLFLTKEQIYLTRKAKEKRLTDFLAPYEPLLLDVKSLACWERPLSSLVILVSVILFLLLVPEHGCFFFLATSLMFGKVLNLTRSLRLWGVTTTATTESAAPGGGDGGGGTPLSSSPSSPGSPPPSIIDVDVPLLSQRLAPVWLQAEYLYERLLRLRWESRGQFCLVVSSLCLIGYFIGDVILPFPVLTLFVSLALTLPALAHHRLHRRLLRRFAPILIQLDLAMDIKRRPLAGRSAGDKRPMRGSRLQDIDEVSDDILLPNIHVDENVEDDDDDQATDGEELDIVDEEVDPALLYNPASIRDPSRELLVQSHLELAPEDRLLSESDRRAASSMHVVGSRHSAPPSLFTTNRDLQDLGLVPFEEQIEERRRSSSGDKDIDVDSADEATGLTPDWSREASGDEDDDTSLMEFLPEGVSRMPSINSKGRSSNMDNTFTDDYLLPRQYVQPPRHYDNQTDQLNSQLLSARSNIIASIATSSGTRMQQSLSALADNMNHNQRQQQPHISSLLVESQIEEALLDNANGNRGQRGNTPGSSASSDDNSGFEILDRPGLDAYDEQALLEAAMREEGL